MLLCLNIAVYFSEYPGNVSNVGGVTVSVAQSNHLEPLVLLAGGVISEVFNTII